MDIGGLGTVPAAPGRTAAVVLAPGPTDGLSRVATPTLAVADGPDILALLALSLAEVILPFVGVGLALFSP